MDRARLDRLRGWIESEGIAFGPISSVAPIAGGTQNRLLRVRAGDRELVLRCPSENARPEAEATIRREARVLQALGPTNVPHARFRGLCDDRDVFGAVFLMTDAVAGFNAAVGMPPRPRENAAIRHRMGLAMIDGIVALSAVDHISIGLADFGKLDGYIERQVARWASQLSRYREYNGWPGSSGLGPVESLGQWLDGHRPTEWKAGLMHGDYHIGNVLFDCESGALNAMLDWELAALGDPLLDLGRLLASWPDRNGESPLSLKIEPWTGFPQREELIERYEAGTGRSMRDLLWYEILACYKLAIILEGTFARACAGLVESSLGDRLHNSARALVSRGIAWLEARA
ncbi:MAG: phosphotransferase family protein [Sphingomonadales bacterium]|nr:phosphotransferase family protein [Sphingomonadales bacterium]